MALTCPSSTLAGATKRDVAGAATAGATSYGLVIWAQQTSGALALVTALRETSIVIGALIGAVQQRADSRRELDATDIPLPGPRRSRRVHGVFTDQERPRASRESGGPSEAL